MKLLSLFSSVAMALAITVSAAYAADASPSDGSSHIVADVSTAPNHRHPGEEIIYIIEGKLEYRLEGQPPVTLKAGDVLFVPASVIHSAKNVGTTNAAELGTYVVPKGKPLTELIK
jgi:mannose-6-phosphate isomerase-like protein (cupin superfamily)